MKLYPRILLLAGNAIFVYFLLIDEKRSSWNIYLLGARGPLLSFIAFPPKSITFLAIISCCRLGFHQCCMLSKQSVNCDQTCCLLQSTKLNLMPSDPGKQSAGSSSWGSQFQSLQPPNIFKVSCALHRSTHGLFLLKVHQQFNNILCSEGGVF